MSEKYVVKDNDLISACFNLSLNEYRLLLLAMMYAREAEPLTFETQIEIGGSLPRRQLRKKSLTTCWF